MNPTYMLNTLPIREKPDRVCAWCGKSDGVVAPSIADKGHRLWAFSCACGSVTYSRTEDKSSTKLAVPSSVRATRVSPPA